MKTALPLDPGTEARPGYRLRRLLGRGTFGEVWEATPAAGAPLAFKFLRCRTDSAVADEVRSIQLLRQLQHPHLTRVDQIFSSPLGYLVVVMELADRSLQDVVDQSGGPLPADRVCGYLGQAALALDFLSSRQHAVDGRRVAFQHCDVKPSNMLLFGGRVKLCDYGLATIVSGCGVCRRGAGTPNYTSPEVGQGRLSERTDQYALAVSYCLLRGGRLPFVEPAARGMDFFPESALEMLSPAERPVVAKALAPKPLDRWPSCGEFVGRLAGLLPGQPPRARRRGGSSQVRRLRPVRP